MLIRHHLIYAIIISIIIYPLAKFNILYFLIGAVLIDTDHYLYYMLKYRKFNPIKIHKYWVKYANRLAKESILIFHTVEFIAIMVILSFFLFEILMFTLGVLVHIALDVYNEFFVMKFHKHYSLFNYIRNNLR